MIIEGLLNVVFSILNTLLFFEIPNLPNEVYLYIEDMFDYLVAGASILANYSPYQYMMTLFGIIITVDIAIHLYHFVMWVLNKIPMLDID